MKAFLQSKNPKGDLGLSGTNTERQGLIALPCGDNAEARSLGLDSENSGFQPCLCPVSAQDLEQTSQPLQILGFSSATEVIGGSREVIHMREIFLQ